MARLRSVKPEYWDNRKLAERCSRDARLLYIGLWNHCDEWSRIRGDARWLKGQVFPYDDDADAASVEKWVDELAAAGVVQRYEVDEDPYLYLPKLVRHQYTDPLNTPSRLPEPPGFNQARYVSHQGVKKLDQKKAARRGSRPISPSPDLFGDDPDLLGAPPDDFGLMQDACTQDACTQDAGNGGAASDAPPATSRGTRLPADFAVTSQMKIWFTEHCPGVNASREHEKFLNYWRSAAGARATKLDWVATWRNWMIRAQEDAERNGPPRAQGSVSRQQEQTDAHFERAMQRAREREAAGQ